MKLPQEQTPEWRREVAIQIVREQGKNLSAEDLAGVGEMTAWNWCFDAFGKGTPVRMDLAMEVMGVARMVGAQVTWDENWRRKSVGVQRHRELPPAWLPISMATRWTTLSPSRIPFSD